MGNGSYWGQSEVDRYAEQSTTGAWWPADELAEQSDGRILHPAEVEAERAVCALGDLLDSLNEPDLIPQAPPLPLSTDHYVALEAEAGSPFALPPEGEH